MGIETTSSTRGTTSRRRSTCKLCPYGIFDGGEPAEWMTRPPSGVSPGLVHVSCARQAATAPETRPIVPYSQDPASLRDTVTPGITAMAAAEPAPAPAVEVSPPPHDATPAPDEQPPDEQHDAPLDWPGVWHHLPRGRVTHHRRQWARHGIDSVAACGATPTPPQRWHGGRHDEQQQAEQLPRCPRCTRQLSGSGIRGVSYAPGHSSARPWRAQITVAGRNRHLGMYATREEARRARVQAEMEAGRR